MAKPKVFENLLWGLNLTQSNNIPDNCFTVAKNVFYNNSKQIQTRRGFRKFWDPIGSAPITSFFYYKTDDTLDRIAVCFAGGTFYKYNETTDSRDSVQANLMEYETQPWKTTDRVRLDFAVYKNVIYMGDWVNPYASYDGTTYTQISLTTVSSGVTFDNTTNIVQKTSHWLSAWDELFFSADVLPAELTKYQVYYVINPNTNDFQLATTKGWSAVEFTDDGTGTMAYKTLWEPRCRYVQYLWDALFWAGDDANPSTLYYTNAAPSDGTNINQNSVVVWGDEGGIINWLDQYAQIVITFKDNKSYAVDVSAPSAPPIDTQTGGYCDRSIHVVGNSLVYFNERGIDTLIKRNGVDWAGAIESKPLSDNVRPLLEEIEEKQYNASAARYIKKHNNYYFSFDTNNDNRPDTTLVYSSLTKARTEYTLPSLYDYGQYENSDGEYQCIFTSANGGQAYEFEYGFDDDGVDIEVQLTTKPFDFWDPAQVKTFDFVDVVWYKQEWGSIDVCILVDDETVRVATITDDALDFDAESLTLWVTALGIDTLGASASDSGDSLPMYPFTVRIPFFNRGATIAVDMQSIGVQWIVEKYRINVEGEPVEVFTYNNIL